MSILFDSVSSSSPFSVDASFAHSVTTSSSGRILMVFVACQNAVAINSVTYAGQSATQLDTTSPSALITGWVYYIVNPATGSNTVAVDFAAAQGNSWIVAASYTGVNPTSPFGTNVKSSGTSGATISDAVTSETNGLVIDWAATAADGARVALTVGADQTERFNDLTGVGGASIMGGVSEEAGATSVTMSWSNGNSSNDYVHFGIPLQRAVGVNPTVVDLLNNVYLDRLAGRTIIMNTQGRHLPPEQVETNHWGHADGPNLPTCDRNQNLVKDDSAFFTEAVSMDARGNLRITAQSESLFESILGQLARR